MQPGINCWLILFSVRMLSVFCEKQFILVKLRDCVWLSKFGVITRSEFSNSVANGEVNL